MENEMPDNFVQSAAIGGAAGIVADLVKDKLDEKLPKVKTDWDILMDELPTKIERALELLEGMANTGALKPIKEPAVLFPYPFEYVIAYRGRAHVCVLLTEALTVHCFLNGAGGFVDFDLSKGWNTLDFPEGSTVALPTTSPFSQHNVFFLYGENMMGDAI
jgi:hypothetical protein